VVPVLLLLLVGVVDLGRAFYAYIAVTNAAREGARYAVDHATTDQYDDIVQVVIDEAAAGGVDLDADDIQVDGLARTASPGSAVTVEAEDTVSMVTGGLARALTFGHLDYEELTVRRSVSMAVAGETESCGCSGR
jgi:Flp pilus assembly protein TadG